MSNLKTRTTRIHLTPDSILHDRAFSVEIDDEGGGEFIIVRNETGDLAIDPEEWPPLRDAIDMMFNNTLKEAQDLQGENHGQSEIGTYLPEQGGYLIGYLNGRGIIMSNKKFDVVWSETFKIVDAINYTSERFSDWRVPTIDELNLAWVNREKLLGLDMASDSFWSSTEHQTAAGAWLLDFNDGWQGFARHDTCLKFRPVRSVSL